MYSFFKNKKKLEKNLSDKNIIFFSLSNIFSKVEIEDI